MLWSCRQVGTHIHEGEVAVGTRERDCNRDGPPVASTSAISSTAETIEIRNDSVDADSNWALAEVKLIDS